MASVRYEKEAPGFNLFIYARALYEVIVVLTCWGVQGGCESWWGDPGGEPTRAVTWHGRTYRHFLHVQNRSTVHQNTWICACDMHNTPEQCAVACSRKTPSRAPALTLKPPSDRHSTQRSACVGRIMGMMIGMQSSQGHYVSGAGRGGAGWGICYSED